MSIGLTVIANCRVAALDLLSFVLSQQVAGRLPVQLLPVGPLDLASPMQRVFLSSDARSNKTLKHALLGEQDPVPNHHG
jgi:hypothetical protein